MKLIRKYSTSLNLNECQRRLHESTGFFKSFIGSGIKGITLGHWFFIWNRQKVSFLYVRNSFRTVCIGSLRSCQEGTIVRCYIGMHPITILFVIIWFGGLIGVGIYAFVSSGCNIFTFFIFSFFIGLMLLLGAGMVIIGKMISSDDDRVLFQFLETTFNI